MLSAGRQNDCSNMRKCLPGCKVRERDFEFPVLDTIKPHQEPEGAHTKILESNGWSIIEQTLMDHAMKTAAAHDRTLITKRVDVNLLQ
jgi:hypothetical protein